MYRILLNISYLPWWYVIVVCGLGGLVVGLCQKLLGDYPKEIKEELEHFKKGGKFETKHLPEGATISTLSLASGGSLDPEAALFSLGAGLGTLLTERIKNVAERSSINLWTNPTKTALIAMALDAGSISFYLCAQSVFSGGLIDGSGYQFH